MAGGFNPSARPDLAGAYFNYESEITLTVPPAIGGVVCIPHTSDWGPIDEVVALERFDQYTAIFGTSDTPLRRAVFGAFKGEGRPGRLGAGAVLARRMAAPDAAAATKTLQNTATTPANALTLTARYKGTRANPFRVTVQVSASSGKHDLLLYDGSRLLEKYTYDSTDITGLAAQINDRSQWVTASGAVSGTALATVTASAFSGGADGTSLTGTEWLAAMEAFDNDRWSIIAAPGLTDDALLASFVAWIKDRNARGRRSFAVVGGTVGEDLADANTRSAAINDWNVVNLGVGTLHLNDLDIDISTSEMTPRVAGAMARRGESKDLFFVRFADVSLVVAPSLADEEDALAGGTTVFSRDTRVDVPPVFIREAVTTYTDDSQSPEVDGVKTHPVKLYKRIKNVRIQHAIELEVDEWATSGDVLGDMPVNDRVRAVVLGFISTVYQRREDAEIVQPGWTVELDPSVEVSDDDDFVQYRHGFHPTRSLRQMFNVVRMG